MFKKPTPLKPAEHADLRMRPIQDYGFARDVLVAPFIIDEVADVAREYPIVFPVGSSLPVALMGVQQGGNAYVASNGQWLASYIPAHIRHYPLALMPLPVSQGEAGGQGSAQAAEAQRRLAILVDMGSELIGRTEGELLFDQDGKLTGLAQQSVQLMERLHARTPVTQGLVRAIENAGVLIEQSIRIQRAGAAPQEVKGLRMINETALNKLDPEAFLKLRAAGALPLVYAALLSWANFRQGPIGRSHSLPAPADMMDNDVIRFD